jgi:hypothetical protein
MTTPLSPAAQAVLDAVIEISPAPALSLTAAAFRAAADHAPNGRPKNRWISAAELLALANELDPTP